jgi:hypothetical protein
VDSRRQQTRPARHLVDAGQLRATSKILFTVAEWFGTPPTHQEHIMFVTAEDFPRWLARKASRRLSPADHRKAVVEMIDWLIGPTAGSTVGDEPRVGHPAAETRHRGRAEAPAKGVPAMA